MEDSILNRIPRLSDSELQHFLHRHASYRREVVEAAASELKKRGVEVPEAQLKSIREALHVRDTGRAPLSSAEEARRSHRLRRLSRSVLMVGLVAAATILALAKPEAPNPLGDEMDQKRTVRDLEKIGGSVNKLAVQYQNDFESLWHGRALAGTVAVLTLISAAGLRFAAGRRQD